MPDSPQITAHFQYSLSSQKYKQPFPNTGVSAYLKKNPVSPPQTRPRHEVRNKLKLSGFNPLNQTFTLITLGIEVHIPKDVLWPFLSGKGQKSLVESPRADLVAGTATIRATLSNADRERQGAFAHEETERPPAKNRMGPDTFDPIRSENAQEMRKQQDRRTRKLHVLLDTRLKQRRGNPDDHPSIDYTV